MTALTDHKPSTAELLARAASGDLEARDGLLESYRNYLRLLARGQIGAQLGLRLEPSDLVQDTLIEAHAGFGEFRGASEGELLAWLRRILARNLADEARRHRRERRDHRREIAMVDLLDRSSQAAGSLLAASLTSPSQRAERREEAVLLADALTSLPDDYQEVIILRHVERLKFEDIAARMNRTSGAVRMLWVRALEQLKSCFGEAES